MASTSRRPASKTEGDVGPVTNTSSQDANATPSSTSGVDASDKPRDKDTTAPNASKPATDTAQINGDTGPATNTSSQDPNAMPSSTSGVDASTKKRGFHTSARASSAATAAAVEGDAGPATNTSSQDPNAMPSSTSGVDASSKSRKHSSSTPSIPQTHYDLFPLTLPRGPPPNGPFNIDLRALRREFLQLQAQAHPDRHSGADKRRAEALSSRINDAYKTLMDPLARAQYVLSLNGIDVAGDETAKVEDQGLLMEVLEARETVEDADTPENLVELREKNEARSLETVRLLEGALENGDWVSAKQEAVRLRYWMNISESLQNWEHGKPVVLQH